MMRPLWKDIHTPLKNQLTNRTDTEELKVLDEGLHLSLAETIFLTPPTPDEICIMIIDELCGTEGKVFYPY